MSFRLVFESGRARNVDVTFNSGDWLIDAGDAACTQLRAAGLDARRQGNILMIAGEQLANSFDSVESGGVRISKINGINVATPLQSQMGSSSGWWSA